MIFKNLLRLLGPILFFVILWFFIDIQKLKEILQNINILFFMFTFILSLLLLFIRSIRWQNILFANGIQYSILKSFRIYCIEMLATIVASTIGVFIKVFYLKKDGFETRQSVISVIADKYFDYTLPFIFGVTSAIMITLKQDANIYIIVLAVTILISFIPLKSLIPLIKSMSNKLTPQKATTFFAEKKWGIGIGLLEIKDTLNFTTYMLTLIAFFIYYFAVYQLCIALSINLTFAQIVMIESFATLISIIPVGFIGVGTRDAAMMLGFSLFGRSFEEAVALSLSLLLLRVCLLLFSSVFWFLDPPEIK